MNRHRRYECGKEATFKCFAPGCLFVSKRKDNLTAHVRTLHFKDLNIIWKFMLLIISDMENWVSLWLVSFNWRKFNVCISQYLFEMFNFSWISSALLVCSLNILRILNIWNYEGGTVNLSLFERNTNFTTKRYFISQRCLRWVPYNLSNISPIFWLLPNNKVCRVSYNIGVWAMILSNLFNQRHSFKIRNRK